MNFVVKKKNWYRGKGGDSCLLRSDGQRCCMGFVAQQLGIPDDILLTCRTISALETSKIDPKILQKLEDNIQSRPFNYTPKWVSLAYCDNDNPDIDDDERIRRLQKLAKDGGHTFTFED